MEILLVMILGFLGIIISLWIFHRDNKKEMKEFHYRICNLKEEYIQMMEIFLNSKK